MRQPLHLSDLLSLSFCYTYTRIFWIICAVVKSKRREKCEKVPSFPRKVISRTKNMFLSFSKVKSTELVSVSFTKQHFLINGQSSALQKKLPYGGIQLHTSIPYRSFCIQSYLAWSEHSKLHSPLKQIILCKMSTPLTNIWVKLLWVKQCIWKSQILTVAGRMWNYCWDVIWF